MKEVFILSILFLGFFLLLVPIFKLISPIKTEWTFLALISSAIILTIFFRFLIAIYHKLNTPSV